MGSRCNLTPEGRKLGVQRHMETHRRQFAEKLANLAQEKPLDIARRYYRMGWKAGARSVRRRLMEAA